MSQIAKSARPPVSSSTVRQASAAFKEKTTAIKDAMSPSGAMQLMRRSSKQKTQTPGAALRRDAVDDCNALKAEIDMMRVANTEGEMDCNLEELVTTMQGKTRAERNAIMAKACSIDGVATATSCGSNSTMAWTERILETYGDAEWLGLCLVQDLVEEAATAAELLEQGRVISEACDAKQDDDYCFVLLNEGADSPDNRRDIRECTEAQVSEIADCLLDVVPGAMDADPCDYYQAYFACHSSCPCGLASVRGVAETARATIAAGALDCAAVVPTCDDAALGGGGVVEVTLFSEAQLDLMCGDCYDWMTLLTPDSTLPKGALCTKDSNSQYCMLSHYALLDASADLTSADLDTICNEDSGCGPLLEAVYGERPEIARMNICKKDPSGAYCALSDEPSGQGTSVLEMICSDCSDTSMLDLDNSFLSGDGNICTRDTDGLLCIEKLLNDTGAPLVDSETMELTVQGLDMNCGPCRSVFMSIVGNLGLALDEDIEGGGRRTERPDAQAARAILQLRARIDQLRELAAQEGGGASSEHKELRDTDDDENEQTGTDEEDEDEEEGTGKDAEDKTDKEDDEGTGTDKAETDKDTGEDKTDKDTNKDTDDDSNTTKTDKDTDKDTDSDADTDDDGEFDDYEGIGECSDRDLNRIASCQLDVPKLSADPTEEARCSHHRALLKCYRRCLCEDDDFRDTIETMEDACDVEDGMCEYKRWDEVGRGTGSEDEEEETVAEILEALSALICVTDDQGDYCVFDPTVEGFLDEYLDAEVTMWDDEAKAEQGAKEFCENSCVNVMIPGLLQASAGSQWDSYSFMFDKGCFKDQDEYCLSRFMYGEGVIGLNFFQTCGDATECSSECSSALQLAQNAWGCCLEELSGEFPSVTTAQESCDVTIDACTTGGEVTVSVEVSNLRHAWMDDNWGTANVRRAVERDVATAVKLARSLVTLQSTRAGVGMSVEGTMLELVIVVQSDIQARTVMTNLQNRRRSGGEIQFQSLSTRVPTSALVNPDDSLSGRVDASSIQAQGAAAQFVEAEASAGTSSASSPLAPTWLLALLALVAVAATGSLIT